MMKVPHDLTGDNFYFNAALKIMSRTEMKKDEDHFTVCFYRHKKSIQKAV